MPTYEYVCRECGHDLEVWQSFSDAALTECAHCGGQLRKKFSAAGIVFKGSGWHIKDYAKSGARGGAKDGDGSDTADPDKADKGDKADKSESSSDSTSGTAKDGAKAGATTSDGAPKKKDPKPKTESAA